jgi:3-methylcrotonyl-CoA carboxylase alpha subunit
MTPLTLRLGDRNVHARVDPGGEVLIDDAAFSVIADVTGLYLVDDGARRWRVAIADAGDTVWVSVDGRVAVVDVETGTARTRSRRSTAGDAMMAPMPATVVKLLVEPGQAVAEGATVLVLEAMKMELPIRAPRDGIVRAVHCTQGELVPSGVALVELE